MLKMLEPIVIRVEMFEEDGQIVSLCPELNVSSFGETKEKAEKSLIEAVSLFLEECERMGTLKAILEEAGFKHQDSPSTMWISREPIVVEKLKLEKVTA